VTVRWGFLGAGWIATRALAPAVHAAAGASLQSVAARDETRAAALSPAGGCRPDYESLLADPTVDAVYISLTNEAHARWSIAALEAGKHVLCEKPLAMNAAEVDTIIAAAAAADRLAVEASWYRWHPRTQYAQRLVASGAVGSVRRVDAGFTFDGRLEGNYRLEPGRGGGALYDIGCYAASAVLWAAGPASVRSVTAQQRLGATGVDLATQARFELDTGSAAVAAGIAEPPRQWLRIEGEDGATVELAEPAFTAWRSDETSLVVTRDGRSAAVAFPAVDAYQLMVEQVSAAIRGEPAWLLPLSESRATAAVLDACFASARSGGVAVAP
jgi:predicted dehydrogenase